jgi:uncharacterized protein (DUF983 family)
VGDPAPSLTPLISGLRLRCPQCGEGRVFQSFLKFHDACAACGANFRAADAGDGPAVFVILIVGAIVAPLLLILQFGFDLPWWAAAGATMVVAVVLCLALLPLFKSVLFALQWKHKARQVTNEDVE